MAFRAGLEFSIVPVVINSDCRVTVINCKYPFFYHNLNLNLLPRDIHFSRAIDDLLGGYLDLGSFSVSNSD
jgi:hypothetical protein